MPTNDELREWLDMAETHGIKNLHGIYACLPADCEKLDAFRSLLDREEALAAYIKAVDFSVTCLREVWESVPGTYDEHDPMVIRHAAALTAIPAALSAVESARAKLGEEGKS